MGGQGALRLWGGKAPEEGWGDDGKMCDGDLSSHPGRKGSGRTALSSCSLPLQRDQTLPPPSLQLSFGPCAVTLGAALQGPPLVSSSNLSHPKHKLTLSRILHFLPVLVGGWFPKVVLITQVLLVAESVAFPTWDLLALSVALSLTTSCFSSPSILGPGTYSLPCLFLTAPSSLMITFLPPLSHKCLCLLEVSPRSSFFPSLQILPRKCHPLSLPPPARNTQTSVQSSRPIYSIAS